jgi:hypothetical protein
MKPHLHSKNSAKKYGGKPEDYQAVHDQMDQSKMAHASVKHRIIFHSAFGVYLVERIFGTLLVNSDGAKVSTRDLAEDHVLEDLGTIPSLDKWLEGLPVETWMGGPTRRHKFIRID